MRYIVMAIIVDRGICSTDIYYDTKEEALVELTKVKNDKQTLSAWIEERDSSD